METAYRPSLGVGRLFKRRDCMTLHPLPLTLRYPAAERLPLHLEFDTALTPDVTMPSGR